MSLRRIVGQELRHLIVERELAVLLEEQDTGGRELLGHRTNFVGRPGRRFHIEFEVGQAVPLQEDRLAALDDGHGRSGHLTRSDRRLNDGVDPGRQAGLSEDRAATTENGECGRQHEVTSVHVMNPVSPAWSHRRIRSRVSPCERRADGPVSPATNPRMKPRLAPLPDLDGIALEDGVGLVVGADSARYSARHTCQVRNAPERTWRAGRAGACISLAFSAGRTIVRRWPPTMAPAMPAAVSGRPQEGAQHVIALFSRRTWWPAGAHGDLRKQNEDVASRLPTGKIVHMRAFPPDRANFPVFLPGRPMLRESCELFGAGFWHRRCSCALMPGSASTGGGHGTLQADSLPD